MGKLSYLALGDSYTIGEGVNEADRWPVLLAAQLRDADVDIAAPRIIATTGWTTDELSCAIDLEEPLGSWDFVSLLIGSNNHYRDRSVADYHGEFHDLLRRAISLAGGRADRVLVMSIPDWGVTPFAIAQGRAGALVTEQLDAYNTAAAQLCDRHGVAFVDITPVTRTHGGEASMLVDDGLHPSASMYQRWATQAFPVAHDLLGDGSAATGRGATLASGASDPSNRR